MTTATIDIGNSYTKVDFWNDEGFIGRHSVKSPDVDQVTEILREMQPAAICVSSVRKESDEFIRRLKERADCRVVSFDSEEIGKYYDPKDYKGNLGPDRLAAALGANVIYPETAKMVVDLGTAMTIDIVDENGAFKGGNISLGLYTRMKALAAATSKLPEIEETAPAGEFGSDTNTAISRGAINGVTGEILYSYEQAKEKYGVKRGMVTGGDGGRVWDAVKETLNGVNDPYMVGRGLNWHLREHYL